jgi:hypothetical protein
MKSRLLLSIALGAILCISSFYQVDAIKNDKEHHAVHKKHVKGKHHVNHKAKHDAVNHTDAVGIATLYKVQKFKILPDKKMVPLTEATTNLHVATTPEHDNPQLHEDIAAGLRDDKTVLFNFGALLGPVMEIGKKVVGTVVGHAGEIVKGVFNAGKSLLGNEGVKQAAKEALVGGGISAALSVGGSVLSTATEIGGSLLGGGKKEPAQDPDQDPDQSPPKKSGKKQKNDQ